jgi:transcriptional regulator with XRE-family HTH domain
MAKKTNAFKTISARLRYARESRKLTNGELAKISKVSPTTITQIESKPHRQVFVKTAYKLAKALEISAAWLCWGEEDPSHETLPLAKKNI